MFTGIVQTTATVVGCKRHNGIMKLQLDVPVAHGQALQKGASIAINGVCLTVVDWQNPDHRLNLCFDVIDETLQRTNLAALAVGQKVNLERALRMGQEIGGHLLSGHVHCMAVVKQIRRHGDNMAVQLQLADSQWQAYLFEKGFIGVDGASLTLGKVEPDGHFWLHLIPETLRLTHFSAWQPGDSVNIEIDQQTQTIVDTVARLLDARGLTAQAQ